MKGPQACITLLTDASSCHLNGLATWSAWAKYRPDTPTMRRSGAVRSDDSNDLKDMVYNEAYAIVEGIRAAAEQFKPPDGTLIVIQTDNETTRRLIAGEGKPSFRKKYRTTATQFDLAIASTGLRPSIRLVRGHKGTTTPGNAVNTWCDRECRRLLKAMRAELATPQT